MEILTNSLGRGTFAVVDLCRLVSRSGVFELEYVVGAVLEGVADRVEVTRRVAAAALLQQGAGPARRRLVLSPPSFTP